MNLKQNYDELELAKEKRGIFVPFILSEEILTNICVLSQCIAYWINFQNICTFTYQKLFNIPISLLITLYTFLFIFKIVESHQCILKVGVTDMTYFTIVHKKHFGLILKIVFELKYLFCQKGVGYLFWVWKKSIKSREQQFVNNP